MTLQVGSTTVIDTNKILQNINHVRFDGGSYNIGAPFTASFNNSHYKFKGPGTIAFSNPPPANNTASMIIILEGSGWTWPSSVMRWNEGIEPPQSSGNLNVFEITAWTSGTGTTRYYGSLVAYNAY